MIPRIDHSRRDPVRAALMQIATFHGFKAINGAFVPITPAERDRLIEILEREALDEICLGCGCTKTDRWLKAMGILSCCDARVMAPADKVIREMNAMRTRLNRKEPGKRQDWIKAEIEAGRGVNRTMIMAEFKCSRAQATLDMAKFIRNNPDMLIYDRTAGVHRAAKAAA